MVWKIYVEGPNNVFTDTGLIFTGTMAEVVDHIFALQAASGVWYAARPA
jgi:hypothetical protein